MADRAETDGILVNGAGACPSVHHPFQQSELGHAGTGCRELRYLEPAGTLSVTQARA